MAKRNDPIRTCVGCGRRARCGELERYALAADGSVIMSTCAPGRGAWLCAGSQPCFGQALRRRRFERAFRRAVVVQPMALSQSDVGNLTLVKG